jgi:hypothetical protein
MWIITDKIYCNQQILEKEMEYNGTIYQQFVHATKPVIQLGEKYEYSAVSQNSIYH